jgi:hypothetical protein
MTTAEIIQEYATSNGQQLRVDRDAGVIKGVKILGLSSKNNRIYEPAAVAKAIPLYEGAKANVNHVRPGEPRPYQDRIGSLKNVTARDDGLYADFHFNPKHPLAEQLIWDAEHAPENVGFSHDVQARTSRRSGKVIVEEISSVTGVDLVANPATTNGLYEEDRPAPVTESQPVRDSLTATLAKEQRQPTLRESLASGSAVAPASRDRFSHLFREQQ